MKTCDFCGKEEMLPHKCSYCGKSFCSLHMLPEKHECPSLPKDSPFWTQKRERDERIVLRGLTHDYCPKCHSEFIGCTSFDENDVNLVCETCWYRWTVPRYKFKTFDPKEVLKQIRETTKKEDLQASRDMTHDFCPKCNSGLVGCTSFDENQVNLVCQACLHKWAIPRDQLKRFNPEEVRKEVEKDEKKTTKKRRWFS